MIDHLERIKIAEEAYGLVCEATLGMGLYQRQNQLAKARKRCDLFAATGYWDEGREYNWKGSSHD